MVSNWYTKKVPIVVNKMVLKLLSEIKSNWYKKATKNKNAYACIFSMH